MNNKQFTKAQHYVPEMHIKNFYAPGKNEACVIDCTIHPNNKPKDIRMKSAGAICYEINQYELTNAKGEIQYPNFVENTLKAFEIKFTPFIRRVLGKLDANYDNPDALILNTEEKSMLFFWISLIFLRTPAVLNALKEEFGISHTEIVYILLALNKFNETIYNPIMDMVISSWDQYTFLFVEATKGKVFFTSDLPVVRLETEPEEKEIKSWFFPLSSRWGIILISREYLKKKYGSTKGNKIRLLNSRLTDEMNSFIIDYAQKFLISSEFTIDALNLIEERRDFKISRKNKNIKRNSSLSKK